MSAREQGDVLVSAYKLTTTDELIGYFEVATDIPSEVLERAIPQAIDALYTSRDAGGNMHSSGALAAVAALMASGCWS